MRIVVVAGEPIVRAGIRAAVSSCPDLVLVGESEDARAGFLAVDAEKPDVVVIDLFLRGMNGIAATREVKRRAGQSRVLVLAALPCERDAGEAFAAGAGGFALKTQPIESLLEAFRVVGRGERYVAPGLRGIMFHDGRAGRRRKPLAPDGDVLQRLSPREREVLDLVVKGWRNRDIARELCISAKTIDSHRTHINEKLGCTGTAELVRFAAENGFLHRNPVADAHPHADPEENPAAQQPGATP